MTGCVVQSVAGSHHKLWPAASLSCTLWGLFRNIKFRRSGKFLSDFYIRPGNHTYTNTHTLVRIIPRTKPFADFCPYFLPIPFIRSQSSLMFTFCGYTSTRPTTVCYTDGFAHRKWFIQWKTFTVTTYNTVLYIPGCTWLRCFGFGVCRFQLHTFIMRIYWISMLAQTFISNS